MPGFTEKLMNALNIDGGSDYEEEEDIYEDDFDDSYDDEEIDNSFLDEEEEVKKSPKKRSSLKLGRSGRRFSNNKTKQTVVDEDDEEEVTRPISSRRNSISKSKNQSTGKVVTLLHTQSGSSFELMTQKPQNTEDSSKICDSIKEGKPVIVNLEALDSYEAQRIIDIVSGCVYAMSGNICKVSTFIFIFTPGNVDITGDLINTSEINDLFPTVENEY